MQLKDIDLNLLRLFDAIFRARNVSRAAAELGLTQPAASQGLGRLRTLLRDPLFTRAAGGVEPTPKAQRLAAPVHNALGTLEQALVETTDFDPKASRRVFSIHMSDIGEARLLPELMSALHTRAPGLRLETRPVVPREQIGDMLDSGRLDFAFGFLPMVKDTQRTRLHEDRYVVLLRRGHPFAQRRIKGRELVSALRELEFVALRSHVEALRIIQQLQVEDRVRLVTGHFVVLPSIVAATDLAVIVPRGVVKLLPGHYAVLEPDIPRSQIVVSLHWSRRFEADPGNRWLRGVIEELFRDAS